MLPPTQPTEYRKHSHLRATHPFYACWYNIYQRCCNHKTVSYPHYGGRGIILEASWHLFENFYKDMWGGWKRGLEIDRINNEEGYSPTNCRWVTRAENCRNTRATKLTADDVKEIRRLYGTITNAQLGKRFNVNASHICRVANGEKWHD